MSKLAVCQFKNIPHFHAAENTGVEPFLYTHFNTHGGRVWEEASLYAVVVKLTCPRPTFIFTMRWEFEPETQNSQPTFIGSHLDYEDNRNFDREPTRL